MAMSGASCVAPLALLGLVLGAPLQAQPQAPSSGASIYELRCAPCHGVSGKGDGPAAALLDPRPRDFTSGRYKFRSTESGKLPTDEDLVRSITEGAHGTSMPAWKPFLSEADLRAVIEHVKSFSPRFRVEQPLPVTMGPEPPSSPKSVEAGGAVYEKLKCAACHGADGRGSGAIARTFKDDWGSVIRATNLTEPWTFRGGSGPRDIYLRFRTGMNGTPMPSFVDAATDKEMWQLALYVKSLARRPVWEMEAGELAAFYKAQQEENAKDPLRRGEYLVKSLGCAFCHSPVRDDRSYIEEFKYAGGQRFRIVPFGDFVSYNLTSDKETGLGGWTDDQIKTFVTKGIRRDGSRMLPFPMPWPAYASLKPEDLSALVAFLRTLPPVSNRIPPPQRPNIVSYLIGKFRLLILHQDPPMYAYPGNAGAPSGAAGASGERVAPNTRIAAVEPSAQERGWR